MELETIDTKISNQTDDDNNQNNNEYQNLNDSIDAPPEIIYTSQSNKQKSKSALSQKVSEFIEVFKKYSQKVQMYIVLGVIVSFISIITKLYIAVNLRQKSLDKASRWQKTRKCSRGPRMFACHRPKFNARRLQ